MSPAFIRSEQLKITSPDKVACLAEHVIQPPPVDCQQQAVILLPRVSRLQARARPPASVARLSSFVRLRG